MRIGVRWLVAAGIGLLVGIVLGRIVTLRTMGPSSAAVPAPANVPVTVQDDRARQIEALRNQLAERERHLALRMEQIAELQQAVAARDAQLAAGTPAPGTEPAPGADAPSRERRPPRETAAARMERLRTEAPEQYADMQQRREEIQQRMAQLHQDRRAFLDAIDTSRMSHEQQENHARLVEAIDAANAFRLRLSSGDWAQLSDEQRAEGFQVMRNLGDLYQQERRYLLEETGRAYGEDGAQFADYIENVIEHTSVLPDFRRGRGGGRRRAGTPAADGGGTP
jgi:DNA repair exonuclease SbcCD ATPase subunit